MGILLAHVNWQMVFRFCVAIPVYANSGVGLESISVWK